MSKKKNDILKSIKATYFIGIGGIGMSSLARYFNQTGIETSGYDKTQSNITDNLIKEGINIHFEDAVNLINKKIKSLKKEEVLIVYTPAIPKNHSELNWFINEGYEIKKRSEILGLITNQYKTVAVAGTHGKTSVSTIIAHIFKQSAVNFNAFLGGISKNYNSNLILSKTPNKAEYAVTEADEFDRSFLSLHPWCGIITSVDEDHLDIYEDINDLKKTFGKFTSQIHKCGYLIIKKGVEIEKANFPVNVFSYSLNEKADYYAENIKTNANKSTFDLVCPGKTIKDVTIQIPGNLNIENAVAAISVADIQGVSENNIRKALMSWTGVKRRFEYIVNTPEIIYIDDYAHHPEELKSFINSIRGIYKEKHITGIFQPHLFTRTRDFAEEFAQSLSLLDELILLEIYPAREKSIPGVTSKLIFDKVNLKNKKLIKKEELLETIKNKKPEILLTIGAGDIDRFVDPIKKTLKQYC
ncbi:MAG: UDP-N-acetylmuramate--L-alanine ligase [Bacteroidales bacterium]|nr:UDP-N-acetylmuramate--L-alanine ligase [Bacteroidales bacterium]